MCKNIQLRLIVPSNATIFVVQRGPAVPGSLVGVNWESKFFCVQSTLQEAGWTMKLSSGPSVRRCIWMVIIVTRN
jgi:hypothetical protein